MGDSIDSRKLTVDEFIDIANMSQDEVDRSVVRGSDLHVMTFTKSKAKSNKKKRKQVNKSRKLNRRK